MPKSSFTGQRLVAVFLLGCLLLNFPLLYLFSAVWFVDGVPMLFVYVFVAWGVVIALLALVVERSGVPRE